MTSVLVVDDDDAFRQLAARMLTALGLTLVAEAGTCAAAIAACAATRPEAALVDVGLPDGDGLELAAQLAALPWRPRVLLTSSDAGAVNVATALKFGAVGFIAKDQLPDGSVRGLLVGPGVRCSDDH
jgi:CheY-like chemotaxis protein